VVSGRAPRLPRVPPPRPVALSVRRVAGLPACGAVRNPSRWAALPFPPECPGIRVSGEFHTVMKKLSIFLEHFHEPLEVHVFADIRRWRAGVAASGCPRLPVTLVRITQDYPAADFLQFGSTFQPSRRGRLSRAGLGRAAARLASVRSGAWDCIACRRRLPLALCVSCDASKASLVISTKKSRRSSVDRSSRSPCAPPLVTGRLARSAAG